MLASDEVYTLEDESHLALVEARGHGYEQDDESEELHVGKKPGKRNVPVLKNDPISRALESRSVAEARQASATDVAQLWRRYKQNNKLKAVRETLILHYLHLVRYVVSRLPVSLPSSIAQEDLNSFGTIGLMEAVERFDPERGLKFETYAVTRIRGAIIDQLRLQDWIPRGVRKRSKTLSEAMARLEEKLGRAATNDELAVELNLPKAKIAQMRAESSNLVLSLDDSFGGDSDGNTFSLMDTVMDKNSPDPQGEMEAEELRKRLADAIATLPEREKLLVALYYHENMTLKEIGEVISVSESRVCQLHAQAITRLRNRLSQV
jgi:RNA polymerase sigma factor FliA